LKRLLVTQFRKSSDGLEWRISQEDKTLFIRGNGRMADYNSTKAPWEDYKVTIQSVTIEEGVKSIGRCSFSGCKELKRVNVSSSVIEISSNPFTDCSKLTRIEVSENNPEYTAEDGVLFNKEKTLLISCPQKMSGLYRVPNGAKK